MKIAVYHYPSLTLGGDTFIFDLAPALAKDNEVKVITSNQFPLTSGKKNLTIEEVKQRLCPSIVTEFPFFKILPKNESLRTIRAILRDSDVLYTKNEIFELGQNFIMDFGVDVPTICGVHTAIFYPFSPTLRSKLHNLIYMNDSYGFFLRRCNAIHVLNAFDYNLIKNYYGVSEKKIFLIPLGVDTKVFRPNTYSKSDSTLSVLFLGKIDEQKGFDVLYRSICALSSHSDFRKLSFTIIGTGKWSNMAENLAARYTNVKYLTFVPQRELVDIYNSHDIFVLPSRWETISYVCLEAQSCGLPVIATNIPGPNSIIDNKTNGLLIKSEDYRALSKGILYMYHLKVDSPAIFEKMKTMSREQVVNRFSLTLEVERLTALFAFVSGQKRR